MSVTERLANLSIPTVLITVAVLFAIRFLLGKQKGQLAKSIAEIAESLAVAMALVFLIIRPFIVQAFFIPSASMHPTLLERDHILVNKFIYRFREPRLGDVVVFKAPLHATPDVRRDIEAAADERGLEGKAREEFIAKRAKRQEKDFIKRVIGVPGDVIRVTPGYVLVNHIQYDHRDLRSSLAGFAPPNGEGKVRLKNGRVLVDGRLLTSAEVAASLGGDANAKVKVVPGRVYINGKPIGESYIAEDPDLPYPIMTAQYLAPVTPHKWISKDKDGRPVVKIPKGKLLVMGDNRNESNDARFWGLLDRRRTLGKAMFIFWPLDRIRLVR